MGDSFSIAGMAGAVSMANASSPAAHSVCLSVSPEVRSERHELGVGPGNPTTLPSGKLGSGTVAVTPDGGNWNVVVAPANVEALSSARPTYAYAVGRIPKRQSLLYATMSTADPQPTTK